MSWSRRRAAVAAEARAEEAARRAEAAEARDTALAERPEAEVLAELGLPDPDAMQPGDDFARFLREDVPAWLRQRALRRLWRTNPVLANVDGLVDYGGDFTDAATVVPNLVTSYEVGKGMARHVMELARQAAEAEAREGEGASEAAPEPMPEAEPEPLVAAVLETPAPVEAAAAEPALTPEEEAPAPAPRRMRFSFEGDAA
ncbi:DUF3306 domain-containing protein [Jannaschia sp. W003]|uniref:DUF3306 domain-containing protein n=1 Tax=Jannaschia sp. W003 TaxID=2867012 RepID=UPI0021A50F00|nr:DUF3306 domain-containing protein [Jannaschia sp. W003]UWQ21476.1 DUF3306 domain-containing protein [Jannaschia sp. W003]